tara:strand:+ start:49 stop:222 length:174 start_codon:yes stop_codon:yes gene_type:complete
MQIRKTGNSTSLIHFLVKSKSRNKLLWEIKRRKRSAKRKNVQLGRVESVFVMVNKNN